MAQTIKLKRSATQNSIPTTSALALGEVAINTYDGKMYIKKSVGGTETVVEVGGGGGVSSSFTVYEYAATANQTTFSGSDGNSNTLAYDTDTPPKILVYLNGVLLDFTTDYTASNGTSVVLTSAAVANDLVQIAAYKSSVSTSLDIGLSDSQKLLLGNSNDLQIYHDGSNSFINETGTGSLYIGAESEVQLRSYSTNEKFLVGTSNGATSLYYNGARKLDTTNTGINVIGSATIADTSSAPTALTIGSSSASNYAKQDWITSAHGTSTAYLLAYGASHSSEAGNFAIKNLVANKEIFFELSSNVQPLRLTSTGATVTGNITVSGTVDGVDIQTLNTTAGAALPKAGGTMTGDLTLSGTDPIITFQDTSANTDPSGRIVFSEVSGTNNFDINYNGTDDRLEFRGSVSNVQQDLVYINRSASTPLSVLGNISVTGTVDGVDIAARDAVLTSTTTTAGAALPKAGGTMTGALTTRDVTVSDGYIMVNGGTTSNTTLEAVLWARSQVGASVAQINVAGDQWQFGGGGTVDTSPTLILDYGDNSATFAGSVTATNTILNTGSTTVSAILRGGDGNSKNLVFQKTTGSAQQAKISAVGDDLRFTTGPTTERVRISSAGNVGIGETNPAEKLHISGGNILLNNALEIRTKDTGGNIRTIMRANSSNELEYGWSANAPVKFMGGGSYTERMRIHTNGNVGIGHSLPDTELHVVGSGNSAQMPLIVGNEDHTDNSTSTTVSMGFGLSRDSGTVKNNAGLITVGKELAWTNADVNIDSYMSFSTYLNNAVGERVRITSAGNVGIGTDAPISPLHIQDTSQSQSHTYIYQSKGISVEADEAMIQLMSDDSGTHGGSLLWRYGDNAFGAIANPATDTLDFLYGVSSGNGFDLHGGGNMTSRVKALSIASDGRIGIGTDAPSANTVLHAKKGTVSTKYIDSASTVVIEDTEARLQLVADNSGSNAAGVTLSNGSKHWAVHHRGPSQSNLLAFGYVDSTTTADLLNQSVPKMVIDTDGHVGVGTDDPAFRFHTYHPTTNVVGRFESGDAQVWIDLHDSNSGNYGALLGHDGAAGHLFKVADASVNTRFLVKNDGIVGIGTSNPQAQLQVNQLGIDTTTTSTSATTQVAIDTFTAATFRSARYTIQVTNSTDSTYHITEILLIHNGTTPQITEYGTIFTGSAEATFDADITSGNVRLLATPATTDSMTFKVVRHCITV